MRNRILFVDDEPLMIEYYSILGAALENDYEVFTTRNGKEALELLAHTPVDIVVSDLVMPEMSGQEFMARVAEEHPESMRIVISAHQDQITVAQCLMFGHRYFSKPFDVRNLAAILKRIGHLKHQIGSDKLKKVIAGVGTLPTVPRLYVQLTEAINSDYASIAEIGEIVEQDPALSLKLLQIANSAYFGMARRLVRPSEAVQVIGLDVLRAIVLCVHAFRFYQERTFRGFSTAELWSHSLQTADGARRLAAYEKLASSRCDEAFVAGLLHDIGKLIMAANAAPDYETVILRSRRENRPVEELEQEIFGANHAQVGAYLLGLWGLPEPIVSAIELHHSLDHLPDTGFSPATALHVAQSLQSSPGRIGALNLGYLKKIGLESRVTEWQRVLQN